MVTAIIAALAMSALPDVVDINGKAFHLSGRPATVVVFVTVDCPIANQYQAEIERQRQQFEPSGVGFFQIHVDPDVDGQTAKTHAKEFGSHSLLVIDSDHSLVASFRAKYTPQAFVLDKGGKVVYQGRIDDRYSSLGKQKDTVRNHDLSDAVAALLAGRKPLQAQTQGYGCLIPRLKQER